VVANEKKPDAFRNFLSKNIDNALALAVIIVIMFPIVARFQLAEGTILFGDFVPTLELRQYLRNSYSLWSNRNSFSYVGSMMLPYLLIFYFPFYITLGDAPVRVPSAREVAPARFVVEVDADRPFMLHFSNDYDPAWIASFGGQTVKSMRVFGVANGFWIDAVGRVVVTVEFLPQRWFYYGLPISLTCLLICVAYTLYVSWGKKRKFEKSV
jgi:hypothetical protein